MATNNTASLEIEHLTRRFGNVEALSDVSLTIHEGEFLTLLGPSGCGKTTLLRVIGGLDVPDEGVVRIDGIDVREIAAHKREDGWFTSGSPYLAPDPDNPGQTISSVTWTWDYTPVEGLPTFPDVRWDHSDFDEGYAGERDQFTIGRGGARFFDSLSEE